MLRRSKRTIEGWAIDVEDDSLGLRDRLAGSTKLWAACLVLIVGVIVVLLSQSLSYRERPFKAEPLNQPVGVYTDGRHSDFANEMVKLAKRRGIDVEAKFLSDKSFKMIMPCDVMNDEVSYLSRAAATGIARYFKVSPVIWTYTEDNDNPVPKLVARTAWSREIGDFSVRFETAVGAE